MESTEKNGIHLISDREMSLEVCLSADKIKKIKKWKGREETERLPTAVGSDSVRLCVWWGEGVWLGMLEGHSQEHGSRTPKDTIYSWWEKVRRMMTRNPWPIPQLQGWFYFLMRCRVLHYKAKILKGAFLEIKRYHLVTGNVTTLLPNPLSAPADLNIGGHILSIWNWTWWRPFIFNSNSVVL